jgi:hypothetical protein
MLLSFIIHLIIELTSLPLFLLSVSVRIPKRIPVQIRFPLKNLCLLGTKPSFVAFVTDVSIFAWPYFMGYSEGVKRGKYQIYPVGGKLMGGH